MGSFFDLLTTIGRLMVAFFAFLAGKKAMELETAKAKLDELERQMQDDAQYKKDLASTLTDANKRKQLQDDFTITE